MRRKLSGVLLLITLTSCSTVRLAMHDYQRKFIAAQEKEDSGSASAPSKEKPTKQALTETAGKYVGTRYRYGSCDASKGFDCSGLVYYVAKTQHILLPRSSQSMAGVAPHIPWKKAEPGDLIFFGERNRINHVGIVEKNKGNEMWIIHSTNSSGVVREDILDSDYWKNRVLFAVDIMALKNGRA